jgi:hypothetical protein
MSEETMQKVDKEIRKIIDTQYALARKLIEDNQDKMHAMAKALLEWETIDAEQIEDIMAGVSRVPPRTGRPRSTLRRRDQAPGQSRRRTAQRPEHSSIHQRGLRAPLCMWAYVLQMHHVPGTPPGFRSTLDRPVVMGIVNVTPGLVLGRWRTRHPPGDGALRAVAQRWRRHPGHRGRVQPPGRGPLTV